MIRFAALALATTLLPLSASADGLLPFQSARQQAVQIAKASKGKFLAPGSGQTLRFKVAAKPSIGKPGAGEIQIWGKVTNFAAIKVQPTRQQIASAKVRIDQGVDGQFVSTVRSQGRVWHYVAYASQE